MKTKKAMPNSAFKKAVEHTADVANCYQAGLGALGKHSAKIKVSVPAALQGSVDIDACTTHLYPHANRWDYVFAYNGEAFFVEVHSGNTSEVSTVLKKIQWLKDWLRQRAPAINQMKARSKPAYYWIQSKKFAIPKNAPQYRAIVGAGLKPVSQLSL
jgi:hypothetical protein